jgi:hypothetical protein
MRGRRRVVAATIGAFSVAVVAFAYCLRPGGALCASELAHAVARVASLDRLTVEVAPPLAASKVDVFWRASGDEGTKNKFRQVVSSGRVVAPIPRGYGENDVEIRYEGRLVAATGQFKTAWWHYHAYRISLRPDAAGSLVATLTATGPDGIE